MGMMDIFGRIKIFGRSGNGCTFFIQDHHPFSDGSALKLDAFLSRRWENGKIDGGNDPLNMTWQSFLLKMVQQGILLKVIVTTSLPDNDVTDCMRWAFKFSIFEWGLRTIFFRNSAFFPKQKVLCWGKLKTTYLLGCAPPKNHSIHFKYQFQVTN